MILKNNEDKFESFDEFIDYIKRGGEVNFLYNQKEYGVFKLNNKYYISKLDENEESIYDYPEEMYSYSIENKNLGDIITELDVFNRLF